MIVRGKEGAGQRLDPLVHREELSKGPQLGASPACLRDVNRVDPAEERVLPEGRGRYPPRTAHTSRHDAGRAECYEFTRRTSVVEISHRI